MENSLIFVIIIMFYFCVIFPLQMRHYIHKRQRRLAALQMRQTTVTNNSTYTHSYRNNDRDRNGGITSEETDRRLAYDTLYNTPPGTESRRDDEVAAARHLEAEHRQQIIDIQREIEQQAIRRREEHEQESIRQRDENGPHMPPRFNDSSAIQAEHSQRIIDLQREIEQEAIRHHEELRPRLNAPHIPSRLINSSTIRSSIYTITSGSVIGVSNSSLNYPNAPPLTPDRDLGTHFRVPVQPNSKDDDLPSYDQAVAFDTTTTSVTIRRY